MSIIDEEDTYHPRGRPIPHVEPEVSQIQYDRLLTLEISPPPAIRVVTPVSPSNVVPKSILKKPKEESSLQDSSNRSIPPEKPIRKMLPQQYQQEDVEDMDVDMDTQEAPVEDIPGMSEVLKTPAMSESDTDSIVSAAEAAKSRRIQSKMRSMTSEEEAAEAEARMAVVNQYTEIVREHSSHTRSLDSAASSRRSSISEDQDQKHRVQEKLGSKPTKKQDDDASKSNVKSKNEIDKQKKSNQTPKSRKESADSRGTTPARDTTKEKRGSKPSSRDQSPAVRRRDLPAERTRGSSSRSSSKTRNRTPSRDRSKQSVSRNDSGESHVIEKSLEQGTRRPKVSSRPSSRSSSRSNSRERYGTTVPVKSKVEKLQKALESNKYRAVKKGSEVAQENAEEERTPDETDGQQLVLEAKKKVRSTMSYVTDLTLLMAAMYVYFFKRETFAIPFIALLLYRRVQEEMYSWIPHRWWWSKKH